MFSDSGLTFLYAFFIFWSFLILVGVVLEFFELGFRWGNFKTQSGELWKKFFDWLEHPPRKKRT